MARFNPQLSTVDNPCIRVRVHGLCYGQATINRFDYLADWPGGTIADCLLGFWPFVRDTWLPAVTDEWTMEFITGELLGDARVPLGLYDDDVNDTGTYVGAAAPAAVAASFLRRTGHRGQRGRGGVRISGIPMAGIEGNSYTAAYQVILQALAVDFGQDLVSVSNPSQRYRHVIANTSGIDVNTGLRIVRAAEVMSYWPDVRVSTQRSRRPRKEL